MLKKVEVKIIVGNAIFLLVIALGLSILSWLNIKVPEIYVYTSTGYAILFAVYLIFLRYSKNHKNTDNY